MKKILFISTLFFAFASISAQDLPPDGKFIMKHKNGETFLTGEVKNNEKHGTWEFFYESGQLQAREKYNEGRPIGVWKTFYPNGRLMEENDFRNINLGDLSSRGSPYPGRSPGVK